MSAGLLYVKAPLWTPAQIDTAAWFDAADIDTFTLDSNFVSQWDDKSGNMRHATQGTAAQKPSRVSSFGRPAVYFVTSPDNLDVAGYTPSGNLSIYFIGQSYRTEWLAPNTYGDICLSTQSAGGGNAGLTIEFYNSYNDATKLMLMTEGAGSSYTEYLDGTLDTDTELSIIQSYICSVLTNATVGANSLKLGAFGDVSAGWCLTGCLLEVIIVDGQDTTAARQRMEGYLAHKWNLVASLPADHPYKLGPPRAA